MTTVSHHLSPASRTTGAESEGVAVLEAMERAAALVAPTWPLDRFIAVNPFWSRVDRTVPEVSSELAALSGARLLMPRAWYRQQWQSGRLGVEHVRQAIAESGLHVTEAEVLALLEADEPGLSRRSRVMDAVDAKRDLGREVSWRDFVVHSTSQFCAAYFDDGQAQLGPDRAGGLFASWRRQAISDRAPSLLMGLRDYQAAIREVPETVQALAAKAMGELEVSERDRDSYLTGLLLDLNGWASWCAYRRWTARLAGADDFHVVELLAIRLAWEWILFRTGGPSFMAEWRLAMAAWHGIDVAARVSRANDWLLQRALEIAWQTQVCRQLPAGLVAVRPEAPTVQAAFCIDVRSEVFRRALEEQDPHVQTMGFAGFFGIPLEYLPVGADQARPQLPGLLAPRVRVTDAGLSPDLPQARRARIQNASAWGVFKTNALSSFTFVESMGPLFAGKLLGDSFGRWSRPSEHHDRVGLSKEEHAQRKPRLATHTDGKPFTMEERCGLAHGMLKAMSLTRDFAPIVLLAGHGSETRNNPHAAGLDCGACCGQTGEVNARAAAALLNQPEVRAGLKARGVSIPENTHFVPALHNTTTDDITVFDLDEAPAAHAPALAQLRETLAGAGMRARRERAGRLGLGHLADLPLKAAMLDRARDWSQVRAEWGLADNAAFIVAPRERSRHLNLAGRSFLHDYRFDEDQDFAVLELIMTAPMVVTHWINFQYYASTVDNLRYGSGNKVLANVVGGHIGVFEGNGGDLRIGLPLQSLHDGERWAHTPLRLSVFIEAPREAIEAVLARHEKVRALVENEWLYLFQLDAAAGAVRALRRNVWVDVKTHSS